MVFVAILSFSISLEAKAETKYSINDLIENAATLDNQVVTIKGEAIGEAMNRGDYTWVNINDGTNAIGVWMDSETAKSITYYGNYKNIGDTIVVTGMFRKACAEHGGEADLHSIEINIEKPGYLVNEQISRNKIFAAMIFSLIAIVTIFIYRKKYLHK